MVQFLQSFFHARFPIMNHLPKVNNTSCLTYCHECHSNGIKVSIIIESTETFV